MEARDNEIGQGTWTEVAQRRTNRTTNMRVGLEETTASEEPNPPEHEPPAHPEAFISGLRRGGNLHRILHIVHGRTNQMFVLPSPNTDLDELQETAETKSMGIGLPLNADFNGEFTHIKFVDITEEDVTIDQELDTTGRIYAHVRVQVCYQRLYRERLNGFEAALLSPLPVQDHVNKFLDDIIRLMEAGEVSKRDVFPKVLTSVNKGRPSRFVKILASETAVGRARKMWRQVKCGTWITTPSGFRTRVFFSLKKLLNMDSHRDENQSFIIDGILPSATPEGIRQAIAGKGLLTKGRLGVSIDKTQRGLTNNHSVKISPAPREETSERMIPELIMVLQQEGLRSRKAGMPGSSRLNKATIQALVFPPVPEGSTGHGQNKAHSHDGRRGFSKPTSASTAKEDTRSEDSAATTPHYLMRSDRAPVNKRMEALERAVRAQDQRIRDIERQRFKQLDVGKFERVIEDVKGEVAKMSHRITNTNNALAETNQRQRALEEKGDERHDKMERVMQGMERSMALLLLSSTQNLEEQRITRSQVTSLIQRGHAELAIEDGPAQWQGHHLLPKRRREEDSTMSELSNAESERTTSTDEIVSLTARGLGEYQPGEMLYLTGGGTQGTNPAGSRQWS